MKASLLIALVFPALLAAGEITVTPPPDKAAVVVGTATFALTLMDKEVAQKELADAKPVDWANEFVGGTLAEVHVLGAQAANTAPQCERVEWMPDIDAMETSAFKRTGIFYGTLFVQDDSLLLQLKPGAGEAVPTGVTIPYAEIASVETKNKLMRRVVVIKRKNGRLDSFSVTTTGGGRIDRDQTKACGDQLAGKLRN